MSGPVLTWRAPFEVGTYDGRLEIQIQPASDGHAMLTVRIPGGRGVSALVTQSDLDVIETECSECWNVLERRDLANTRRNLAAAGRLLRAGAAR